MIWQRSRRLSFSDQRNLPAVVEAVAVLVERLVE
jgi:hypothetical protein